MVPQTRGSNLGAITLSYPLGLGLGLSAKFFHDESSIIIGGYKSAIAPKFVGFILQTYNFAPLSR